MKISLDVLLLTSSSSTRGVAKRREQYIKKFTIPCGTYFYATTGQIDSQIAILLPPHNAVPKSHAKNFILTTRRTHYTVVCVHMA